MQNRTEERRARALAHCRDALACCDDATLRRLEMLLGSLAQGARLDRFLVTAPADLPLPPEMAHALALLDPAAGQA